MVPIYEAGESYLVSNYRQISILSTLAKVFESLIYPLIQNYFKKYISNHQHGFIPGRSTCSNLVSYIEHVIEAVDSNKQVDAIYTDICKAFEKVLHDILIRKLAAYDFAGSFLKWLSSYLADRTFHFVAHGYKSNTYKITSGIPQGSHLGPLLFIIFINDQSACLKNLVPFLFADDPKMGRVIELDLDTILLQEDISNLLDWCAKIRCNLTSINAAKLLLPENYNG